MSQFISPTHFKLILEPHLLFSQPKNPLRVLISQLASSVKHQHDWQAEMRGFIIKTQHFPVVVAFRSWGCFVQDDEERMAFALYWDLCSGLHRYVWCFVERVLSLDLICWNRPSIHTFFSWNRANSIVNARKYFSHQGTDSAGIFLTSLPSLALQFSVSLPWNKLTTPSLKNSFYGEYKLYICSAKVAKRIRNNDRWKYIFFVHFAKFLRQITALGYKLI